VRLRHDGGRGDDGNLLTGLGGDGGSGCGDGGDGSDLEGKDLLDAEVLGGEDAIQALERKRALAIEEVGDVGLGQQGRLTSVEDRVLRHEQALQRMKGMVGAFGGLLTALHLAIDYFTGRH
jgi:hypothetical protein